MVTTSFPATSPSTRTPAKSNTPWSPPRRSPPSMLSKVSCRTTERAEEPPRRGNIRARLRAPVGPGARRVALRRLRPPGGRAAALGPGGGGLLGGDQPAAVLHRPRRVARRGHLLARRLLPGRAR